ncbi:hypothetical protein ASC72_04875 [Flavobacterium sp. Root420]|nr:hypothetical protein ASC72_04875 [Flavobacterium sp. Root420]
MGKKCYPESLGMIFFCLELDNFNLPECALGITSLNFICHWSSVNIFEAVSFYEVERNKRYSRKPDRRERPKKEIPILIPRPRDQIPKLWEQKKSAHF